MTKLDIALLILERLKKEKVDELIRITPDKKDKRSHKGRKKRRISRVDVIKIVNLFIEILKDKLLEGERIDFRRFGSFQRKLRKTKKARNPKTKEVFDVSPYYIPFFKASKEFKELFKK